RKLFNKHSAIGGSYTINYIALRRSPRDRLETTKRFPTFPEIDNISRRSTSSNILRNTLLKALESWRILGERIKRTTELYSQRFINKNNIFLLFILLAVDF
ncbi:hypothetical protein AABB24_015455, partial [Solanum stoloniferum]